MRRQRKIEIVFNLSGVSPEDYKDFVTTEVVQECPDGFIVVLGRAGELGSLGELKSHDVWILTVFDELGDWESSEDEHPRVSSLAPLRRAYYDRFGVHSTLVMSEVSIFDDC